MYVPSMYVCHIHKTIYCPFVYTLDSRLDAFMLVTTLTHLSRKKSLLPQCQIDTYLDLTENMRLIEETSHLRGDDAVIT